MNYQRIYENLISTRKNRVSEDAIYYERHHIIMRSMGGSNDPENIVKLTAREHFLAHWLLWRIHRNREAAYAFKLMCEIVANKKCFSSVAYSEIKKELSVIESSRAKEKWKNSTFDREKFSKRMKTFNASNNSELNKKNLSKWMKLRAQRGGLQLEKNPMYGKKHSEASKNKNSHSVKLSRQNKVACIYCKKEVDSANLNRWHNEKCRSKPC